MPVFNNILAGASAQGDDYHIDQSLRFRQTATLNRGSFTNTATWTYSCWFKPSWHYDGTSSGYAVIGSSNIYVWIENDTMHFRTSTSNAGTVGEFKPSRDKSAWYHCVINQTSGSANATLYINGVEVTNAGASNWTAGDIVIGTRDSSGNASFMGYIAEVFFIYGTSRPPTDFAEANSEGVWVPKDLASELSAADYGAEGGYYKFADKDNLGTDSSGNGNTLTVNSTFVNNDAHQMTNDVLVLDTPTNNFCTLNPHVAHSRSNHNFGHAALELYTHDGIGAGTTPIRSGKWYWEVSNTGTSSHCSAGIMSTDALNEKGGAGIGAGSQGTTAQTYGVGPWFDYTGGGVKRKEATTGTDVGTSWTTANDILGVAFDADARKLWFAVNNTWVGSGDPANGTNETWGASDITALDSNRYEAWVPYFNHTNNSTIRINFGQLYVDGGQRETDPNASTGAYSFKFTPPSGFKTLSSKNMPDVPIKNPGEHFDSLEVSENSGTAQTVSGLSFQPDIILWKSEFNGAASYWWDCTRGFTEYTKVADENRIQNSTVITGVTSTGFNLGTDSGSTNANSGGGTTQFMCWKAGGAPTTNNDNTSGAMDDGSVFVNGAVSNSYTPTGSPTIYPQMMSVNTVGKIAVIKYEGTGTAGTVPHGLGVRPTMILYKGHNSTANEWARWHCRGGDSQRFDLSTRAQSTDTTYWVNNTTNCDEHHFHVGTSSISNSSGETYTAYVFADVVGFQQHGLYGAQDHGGSNGFVDGKFTYTGFKPNMLWARIRDDGNEDEGCWTEKMDDNGNYLDRYMKFGTAVTAAIANSSVGAVNFNANGFKMVQSTYVNNTEANKWIYSAWASEPFMGGNIAPATGYAH